MVNCARDDGDADRQLDDPNWVQTALSQAIAAEDFTLAATCVAADTLFTVARCLCPTR